MADVQKDYTLFVSPPAEGNHVVRGIATVAIERGDPVEIDASVDARPRHDTAFKKPTAAADTCFGIAQKTVNANQTLEVMVTGEMDGYKSLTQGAYLSVNATGKLDTTAPTTVKQLRVLNPTRIIKTF